MVLPVEFLSKNTYDESQIEVVLTNYKRETNPEIENRIEKNWNIFEEEAKNKKIKFYNGHLARCVNVEEKNGKIIFTTGEATFKERMGILPGNEIYLKFHKNKSYMPNPLTVGTVIVTNDGKIPIEIRGSDTAVSIVAKFVDTKIPMLHEPSGFVLPEDGSDPRKTVMRNIYEIAKSKVNVIENKLVGVIYEPNIDETFCCFVTKIGNSSENFLNDPEKFVWINNTKEDIEKLLDSSTMPIFVYTRASLQIYLNNRIV